MKVDRIRTRLEELGLGEEQADVYLHLHRLGQAKASDVADLADLHRSKAYRLLEGLVEEGFVESTMGRPKRYVPVPLDDLFARLRRRAEQRVEVVDRIHGELADALDDLQADVPEEPSVQFLTDRLEGMRTIGDMVAGAERQIRGFGVHEIVPDTLPKLGDLIRVAAERAEDGVDVQVLLHTDDDLRATAREALGTPDFQIRHGDAEPLASFVVADDEAIVWMSIDPSGKINTESDTIMRTDAPEFLALLLATFEERWPDATPIEEL